MDFGFAGKRKRVLDTNCTNDTNFKKVDSKQHTVERGWTDFGLVVPERG